MKTVFNLASLEERLNDAVNGMTVFDGVLTLGLTIIQPTQEMKLLVFFGCLFFDLVIFRALRKH
jgi:hypothetical protein